LPGAGGFPGTVGSDTEISPTITRADYDYKPGDGNRLAVYDCSFAAIAKSGGQQDQGRVSRGLPRGSFTNKQPSFQNQRFCKRPDSVLNIEPEDLYENI